MTPERRSTIAYWVLGLAMLIVTIQLWPDLHRQHWTDWLLAISLVALVALVESLGIRATFGTITFMPVTALMAYLALGTQKGVAVVVSGLALSGIFQLIRGELSHVGQAPAWSVRIGRALWPIAQNGFSLLAADAAYRLLSDPPPLTHILTLDETSPVLAGPVVFLLVYNLLLALDLALRKIHIVRAAIEHRRALPSVQVLPMMLAPFSAIALADLGILAFLFSELFLLAIVIAVSYLSRAQDSLQEQVKRLNAFSSMNRAFRTTLDVNNLVETLYLQVTNLLRLSNLHILLGSGDPAQGKWRLALAVENGRRVQRTTPDKLDAFTSRILDKGYPLLADPVAQTAERLKITHPPQQVRAWMGAPMMPSKRVLGCVVTWLGHDDQPGRSFEEADLEMFVTVVSQAGVAIENALLYKEAQQHAAQLSRLNKISAVMNASLNPEQVLELVAESVIEVVGCDRTAIYLLESESSRSRLLLAHAQGFKPGHIARSKDIAVPLSDSERKLVMEEGKAVAVADIHDSKADVSAAALLLAEHESFASYAYVPLRAQKSPIGMLAVYYNQPHQFLQDELDLLETFANQAALAVVNARIYQQVDIQLTRRVEQIVRLADLTRRLTSTLDMETIFELLIDQAMEGCNADTGVLVLNRDPELGDEDAVGLNMVSWRGFDPARGRAPHHVAEGLATRALESGEAVLTSSDDAVGSGPRSQLGVPIMLEGRTIGAIALESEVLNAFTEEDVTFVSQLAIQAAVTIRNAQLYRRAQIVRDRLHAILDASSDGLLMIDAKSRIVMTNTRMGDFWDFARQDFAPPTPDQFLADPLTALGEGLGYREGELSELLVRGIRNPALTSKTDLYVTHPRPGQRQRFIQRTATPVRDEQGGFIGLLLSFVDITDQKELEEARESLTSMIVHDLRSPLQAVMGSMRLIGEVVPPEENPVIEQATQVSTRAVKKLLNLVNNLLDLSRLERGEVVLDTHIESVKEVLEDAAQELMPLAQEMDAVVKVQVPDDLPYAQVDRDMVERVVLNLLDNALKYTQPGSLVTLQAEVVKPEQAGRSKMIKVKVTDNGPGVPKEYKEKIFDRFSQIPGQTGHRRSAGLGLAFCRTAIESHGGRIWVEDNPAAGGGSIFNFTLPISTAPPKAKDQDAASPKKKEAKSKSKEEAEEPSGSKPKADEGKK